MSRINYIKQKREEAGYSVNELAERIGKNRATVYRYENGNIENVPSVVIEKIASVLGTSATEILGYKDNTQTKKSIKIPVLGTVAAGIPIEAVEDILDYEEITADMAMSGTYFGLQIKGESMSPRMLPGDVVIVRQQPDADSGDIVIAKINGDDACCKKLLKLDDGISLISFNPTYEPMYFNKKEVQKKPVVIIGKVVELRGKF